MTNPRREFLKGGLFAGVAGWLGLAKPEAAPAAPDLLSQCQSQPAVLAALQTQLAAAEQRALVAELTARAVTVQPPEIPALVPMQPTSSYMAGWGLNDEAERFIAALSRFDDESGTCDAPSLPRLQSRLAKAEDGVVEIWQDWCDYALSRRPYLDGHFLVLGGSHHRLPSTLRAPWWHEPAYLRVFVSSERWVPERIVEGPPQFVTPYFYGAIESGLHELLYDVWRAVPPHCRGSQDCRVPCRLPKLRVFHASADSPQPGFSFHWTMTFLAPHDERPPGSAHPFRKFINGKPQSLDGDLSEFA